MLPPNAHSNFNQAVNKDGYISGTSKDGLTMSKENKNGGLPMSKASIGDILGSSMSSWKHLLGKSAHDTESILHGDGGRVATTPIPIELARYLCSPKPEVESG